MQECGADGIAELLAWAGERLDVPHTVESLAARASMSTRTFARRFAAETGSTPVKWLTGQRILLAQQLLEQTDAGLEQIAHRCGFSSAALLRHHFHRRLGLPPAEYRRRFGGSDALVGTV